VKIDGKTIDIFPAAAPGAPLFVLNTFVGEGKRVNELCRGLGTPDFSMAAVSGLAWDDDLTPWQAPPIRRGEPPCAGRAEAYLTLLRHRLLPAVREELGAPPAYTAIAGYSLAGLFALWAACRCDAFAAVVSASGSLWYPGFAEFAETHPISAAVHAVYLSLGDGESKTKNPYLKTVAADTERIYAHLKDSGVPAVFEWNSGNHFRETDLRTARGILWALREGRKESL